LNIKYLIYLILDDFESQKMLKHRNFFREQSQFKNILNISDENIINKIHQNYRLSYLMDTAIGRFIVDSTIKNVSIIIHYNNSEIIQYFLNSPGREQLASLMDMIKCEDLEKKNESINMLIELINCAKELVNILK
jgi:hypothetical protein